MQMINTPMLHSKYLHLKKLSINLNATTFNPAYDYLSLVSFFDACPSLETLVLNVSCCICLVLLLYMSPVRYIAGTMTL
jgi:hypothetical protein